MRQTLPRALAPLALMAVIFVLSAQPGGDVDWNFTVRKLGHAAVYGGLTALWAWTLAPTLRGRAVAVGAIIAVAYAATDEYHQSFVPGRTGTAIDVAIDAAGALVAVWLIKRSAGRRPPAPARTE